ncbi:MAG: hypothetical protein AAFN93_14520 [Bacteroidota bacterium]
MKSRFLIIVSLLAALPIMAQENSKDKSELPYREIPEAPTDYSSGNVIGRMIDGLGYRYYWATEGLKSDDMDYKPSEDGRSIEETLTHIYGLSQSIVNAPQKLPNVGSTDWSGMSFEEKRRLTLQSLQKASELVKGSTAETIAEFKVIFQNGDRKSEFPYWNMINGQISDALYHTGQIVLMRRAAGNPIPPGVNVFIGKTRGL